MRVRFERLRPWLTAAGIAAAVVVLLPPAATAARHYVFAEAVQFAVLAMVTPALLVLGAPWRFGPTGLASRLANRRSHRPRTARTWLVLVVFIAVALAWRLPVAVNALVTDPVLTVVEAVTLLAAGCALWLELAGSPPLLPRTTRPQRAAFAALPMWAIWASAYIMGFSGTTWFGALAHQPGRGLSTVADQEIAAFILFAIPGLSFVPVVYVALITWLRDSSDPDDEMREVAAAGVGPPAGASPPAGAGAAAAGAAAAGGGQATEAGTGPLMPRPPRGWRLPS